MGLPLLSPSQNDVTSLLLSAHKSSPRGSKPNANNGKKKNRGFSGKRPRNYEELLKGPCPHHATADGPATHSWENCFVMRDFRAEAIKKSQNDDPDQRQE